MIKALNILLLLAVLPGRSYGQFSDDSLKKLSIRNYNREYMHNKDGVMSPNTLHVQAYEVYKGAFSNIKMFAVEDMLCDDCATGTYIFDVRTGKLPDLKNIDSFNNEMNKCPKPLINFDKSCFYLILNDISWCLTQRSKYADYLVKGSIFRGLPETELIHYSVPMCQWKEASGKGKMYVGALTYDRQKSKWVEAMYEFKYDVHGQLISVRTVDIDEFVPTRHWNPDWAPFLRD